MSDDFNNDDLDWLRDDGDDGDDSYNGDDDDLSLELDWLRDDDQDNTPRSTEDSTGLTGDLAWQGAGDDDSGGVPDESSTGVTGKLSWQGESDDDSAVTRDESSTGVTGQLSWRGDERDEAFERQLDEAESQADSADFSASSFLGDDDNDDDEDIPDVDTGDLNLPDWMQGMEMPDDLDLEEASIADEPVADASPVLDDAPDWLSDTGSLIDESVSDDAPDWLSDTGSLIDESVSDDAPDWLSDTGSLIDESVSDDAPDWLSDTGSLIDESVSDDAPDWLSDTGSLSSQSIDDDMPEPFEENPEVPDWLAGTGSLLDDDDGDDDYEPPGWLADTGSLLAEDNEQDVFAGQSDPEPQAEESVPDWLSGGDTFGESDDLAEPMMEDAPEAEESVPDWLSGGDTFGESDDLAEPVMEDAPEAEESVPDWLSGGDTFGESDEIAEPALESDIMDEQPLTPDWLDEPAMTTDEVEDDLAFDAFDAFENTAPAAEDEAGVDDFADLFGEDDFALETSEDSEEFDLLGELTADSEEFDLLLQTEADEESDSFDLLGELGMEGNTGLTGLLDESPSSEAVTEDSINDLFGDDEEPELDLFEDEQPDSVEMNTGELAALFGDGDDEEPELDLFEDDDAELEASSAVIDDLFGDIDPEPDLFEDGEPAGVEMNTGELAALFGSDEDEDERVDWFAEEDDDVAVAGSTPDWLDDVSVDDFQPESPALQDELSPESPVARYDNVDDYLSSFGEDSALALPDTGMLENAAMDNDFDALFDTGIDDFSNEDDEQPESEFDPSTNPDRPDWLDDVNVGGVSASVALRSQKDSPIEELPDRLQALHDRGRNMSVKRGEVTPELQEILPEVSDVLPSVDFGEHQSAASAPLNLSAEQRGHINVLRGVVGGGTLGGLVASPFADDLRDDEDLSSTAKSGASRRFLSRTGIERFFIMLLLALAVILPFVNGLDFLQIGELPPPAFEAGSEQQAFFDQIDALNAGDLVLVAAEYGPTGAAEMDPGTQAMLVHILSRGARPFVVSGNPVGLLHAHNMIVEIGNGIGLTQNDDYYVGRYLVGDAIGLRTFSITLQTITGTDLQGRSTNLDVESLDEFALMVVITDRSDRLRLWAEQVASDTVTPMLGITGNAAAPLARPYLQAENNSGTDVELSGLLVGYRDAYTYLTMLGVPQESGELDLQIIPDDVDESPAETPDVTPEVEPTGTFIPSATPTTEPTSDATEEAVVPEATTEDVNTTPTEMPTNTATVAPTNTPEAEETSTLTQTPLPTNTPEPSPTPTQAVEMVRFGVVNASTSINVRSGPSTSDSVVSVLRPNSRVLIVGENDDASWYEVLLEDGTPGWVAEFLLNIEIEMVPIGEDDNEAEATPESDDEEGNGKRRVIRYQDDEPTAEATEDVAVAGESDGAIVADEIEETTQLDDSADESDGLLNFGFGNIEYRDERWYAMNLGLVASIVIIFVGNILNVLRALRRRRRGE